MNADDLQELVEGWVRRRAFSNVRAQTGVFGHSVTMQRRNALRGLGMIPSLRMLDGLLWLLIVTGAGLSVLGFFAGSVGMMLVPGAFAAAAVLARGAGKARGAYGVAALGVLTTLLTWRMVDGRVVHEPIEISETVGSQRLRSGGDPQLCGPGDAVPVQAIFYLKPPGFTGACEDIDPGIQVTLFADQQAPQRIGTLSMPSPPAGAQPVQGGGTAVEEQTMSVFLGPPQPLGGGLTQCDGDYCTLVYRRADLVVRVRWSAKEAGEDPRVVAALVESRLDAWTGS